MRYIDKFVWKPMNWNPASPDQPERLTIEVGHRHQWEVWAASNRATIQVDDVQGRPPLEKRVGLFTLPADRLLDVVEALLYVHRRTHEDEYRDADWSEDSTPGDS